MPETPSATILIVDDAPENLAVLNELLQPVYRVRIATSGEKALRLAVSSLAGPDHARRHDAGDGWL